jgi:hypothetical protein
MMAARVAVRWSLVLLLAVIGLPGAVRSARACVCLTEGDAAAQRQKHLADSDLAFIGTVVRVAAQAAPRWTCEGDGEFDGQATAAGCLVLRVAHDGCQGLRNVKARVRAEAGGEPRTGYTDGDGTVQFCALTPGTYHLELPGIPHPTRQSLRIEPGRGVRLRISVDSSGAPARYRTELALEKTLKGSVPARVVVGSEENLGGCGFGAFAVGKRYEVFARKKGGELFVDLCSGSHPLPP